MKYLLRRRIGQSFLTSLPFAGLWWALAGNSIESWVVGAPAVVIATWTSIRLATPPWWRFRPIAALRFLLFFTSNSFRGGLDVAWRALQPRLRLEPGFFEYAVRLPEGPALLVFASTTNLLPGTLCAKISAQTVTIHALDPGESVIRRLRELEDRVADLFGLEKMQ